jgi:hypothetical protein
VHSAITGATIAASIGGSLENGGVSPSLWQARGEGEMTRRPGEQGPPPEGGHAAERLRQFREAREPGGPSPETSEEQPRAPSQGEHGDDESDEKSDVHQDGDV